MFTQISCASPLEQRIQKQLRNAILEELQRRHMSNDDLAEALKLLPAGARALLDRQNWPIEIALRIAESLNMKVELKATP